MFPPLQLLLQPFAVKPLMCFNHRLWFRTCSCRHSESRDQYQIVVAVILALIMFLQVPLRSSSANLPFRGNLTTIGPTMRTHALPKYSVQKLTRSTRRHALQGSVTRLHTPPRARSSPADVSPRWCHHCHVICWRHLPVSWHHRWLGRWPDRWPTLTLTEGWLWPLTFCQSWLLQSRCSLPNFLRRFHFYSLF